VLPAYDLSDVTISGGSGLRTSNLLDLLGRVIHELCPSALVFLHAGHGFGVFGSLGDVFGFDRVHCNDPGRSIWLQSREANVVSIEEDMSEVNRSTIAYSPAIRNRWRKVRMIRIIVTEKANLNSNHDPRPLYIDQRPESQPEEYSIFHKTLF
jgi:hypothetical protein